jgi:AAA family ATP:ADP antiporter
MHPTIGLANEKPSPWRILGWVSYCSIESFGSVMVSLFWSFANSNISLETAKASYGVMVATAQVGSILGPTFVNIAAPKIGPAKCYCVGAMCILLLQGSMRTYVRRYGVARDTKAEMNHNDDAKPKKKEKPGVLEGLVLFWKHNYVKGIFAISCLFMVEVTIIDFTMKLLAQEYFAEEYPCQPGMSCYDAVAPGVHGSSAEATAAFSAFMGFFGQAANTLSFLLSLLGTSAVIRYLGLRLTLLLFPSLCLLIIITVRLHPTLYVVFGAMMTLKGCSYGLNNPTKEILYQPTSTAVRYKAKSWIDIFGARGSKAVGSLVTNAFSDSAKHLVANGSIVGMMVASFLIWNATFMGRKFDEYTSTGYIVGGDNDEDKSNIEMAMNQNENEDTSCAIYDDDEVGPEEEGQSENGSSPHDDDDQEEDDAGENTADFAKEPEVQRV